MRNAHRLFLLLVLSLACAIAFADSSIRLSTFPAIMAVADGRSTIRVKAEIRDQNGRNVPDGTRVLFSSTLGATFREATVLTMGGTAFGTLIAGTQAGIATITVSALSGEVSPATINFEFVSDRSQLSSANEYVEVVSPVHLQYAADSQIVEASGINGGVSLRYRDLSLTADDLQYSIQTYELRARKVKLKMGKFTKDFDELYLRLKDRIGFGTTTFKAKRADSIVTQGSGLAFVRKGDKDFVSLPPDEDRYGLVEVSRTGIAQPVAHGGQAGLFGFQTLVHSPSTISARKVIIFPHRKVQFQKASIYVAGEKVMSIPLYEYSLSNATPLVTEQMLAINNSQIEANYPYFLSLRPGETSLLRLRTGNQYGRANTTNTGVFLDYELNWDHGDDLQGSFIFSGIGRDDWTAGVNQYWRIDDRTSMSAQLFTPTGRSYFGSASASHQFNGFSMSANADVSRTIEGIQYTASNYSMTLAKDPIKVGKQPFRIYLELTETSSYNQLIGQTQSGVGARARIQSLPLPIDKRTNVVTSLTTSYLVGRNELHGLQYQASTALNHRFSNSLNSTLTYNYTRDGFNEYAIGQHEMVLQSNFNSGHTTMSLVGSKSLDLDRSTLFADLGYRFSKLWRIKAGYTYDRYLNTKYIDYDYGFTYRMGWREVGLIWAEQTKRIGFQFLGTTVF